MLANLEELAASFHGTVKGSQAQIKCPCHEDSTASLSVTQGDNGNLIVHCFAGCDQKLIHKTLQSLGYMTQQNVIPLDQKKKTQKKIQKTYIYRDSQGNEAYQKIRYEGKGFSFRVKTSTGFVYSLKGIQKVLYKLPDILTSGMDIPICITEGEKDADNLQKILGNGFVTTTNPDGAGKWTPSYNQYLKERDIIIFQDNDESGEKHTRVLTRALAEGIARSIKVITFPDLPPKSDVSDYIKENIESAKERIEMLMCLATPLNLDAIKTVPGGPWERPEGKDHADYEDYVAFVYGLPQVAKITRCVLTDALMVLSKMERRWDYLHNYYDYIKGHARNYQKFFQLDAFEHYMERHRLDDKPKELRIDIPAWDGRDRILSQARVFRCANVTPDEFAEIVKQWGAGIFKRLKNPGFQNPCLILQGCQGLGKDSLIESWIGGLDDYKKDLNLSESQNSVEEIKKTLHTALVFSIPEFDKTSRVDPAFIKDIIFKSSTDIRLSYDKRDSKRDVRASFVASCNKKHVFVDDTGNRRFIMLECQDLGFYTEINDQGLEVGTGEVKNSYPGLWVRPECEVERLQILAQFRALADSGFVAHPDIMKKIRTQMSDRAPESIELQVCRAWELAVKDRMSIHKSFMDNCEVFLIEEVSQVMHLIGAQHGKSLRVVQTILGDNYREAKRIDGKVVKVYRARPKTGDAMISRGIIQNDDDDMIF